MPHEGEARIVSLSPALTELVFALDLGTHLVGRTGRCAKSVEGLAAVSCVGDLHSIDYERLQSLNPTHVLMDFGNTPKTVVDALDALELPLLSVEMTDPQQNFDLYSLFGAVFSVPMAADTLSRRFEAALARVTMAMRNKTRQRVLYLAQKDPYQTVAKSSYGAALLDLAQLELIGAPETASEMEDGGALAMTESLLLSVNKILFNGSSVKFKRADIKAFAEEFGVPRSKLVRLDNDPNMQFGVRAIDSMDRLIACGKRPTPDRPVAPPSFKITVI